MKTKQVSEPGYVYPCRYCQPDPAPGASEHWQGRESEPDVLIGYHVGVAPMPTT